MNYSRTCPSCGQSLALTPWLDEGSGEVILPNGTRRALSPTQLEIVIQLRRHGSAYCSVERLFETLYGDRLDPPTAKTVTIHIAYLRKNLEGTGATVENRRALGYRLATVTH